MVIFESIHKLKVRNYVVKNNPTTKGVLKYAKEVTGREIAQSTVSTMLKRHGLAIRKAKEQVLPVEDTTVEVSPREDTISPLVHIPYDDLTTLKEGKPRKSFGKDYNLEVKVLEEIYHCLMSGYILNMEKLKSIVDDLSYGLQDPPMFASFYTSLTEKYYLADKLNGYFDKKFDYETLMGELMTLYPSLEFASLTPNDRGVDYTNNVGIEALGWLDELSISLSF